MAFSNQKGVFKKGIWDGTGRFKIGTSDRRGSSTKSMQHESDQNQSQADRREGVNLFTFKNGNKQTPKPNLAQWLCLVRSFPKFRIWITEQLGKKTQEEIFHEY